MTEWHEQWDALPERIRDQHRALKSLQEEIEAVDWYNQRIAVTGDDSLRAILEHNRNEEVEHAAMVLEWLRRHMDGWDEELRTYVFTTDPITEVEEAGAKPDASLGLGSLQGEE
jgi:ferritin-like protein